MILSLRYAVSILWELEKESYEVLRVCYNKTIIRSAYKLAYETAQGLLDGDTSAAGDIPELKNLDERTREKKLAELVWAISKLTDIARHVRAKRDSCGALELEGVEIRVQLDDQHNIHDLIPKQPLEVHETVAECMILANHWVAKKISENFPHQALLRQHPPPRQEFFTELRECASSKGFAIDTRYLLLLILSALIKVKRSTVWLCYCHKTLHFSVSMLIDTVWQFLKKNIYILP